MKAITTTIDLKSANGSFFLGNAEGTIKQILTIPRSFVSLNYNPGRRTDGYHLLDNSIHESDGFFDVVDPVYDPSIEKLGAIYFDTDHFTFPVVAMSQAEIDAFIQQQEDADASSNTTNQYKTDGVIGFDRAMALIQRKFDNGIITDVQKKNIIASLYPIVEPLTNGRWELVQSTLNTTTPPVNADLLIIFNKIKDAVDNYVLNNY